MGVLGSACFASGFFARFHLRGAAIAIWLATSALWANGDTVRFGFTAAMLPDLNENDAKASIKALAAAIARERGLSADPEPNLYEGTDAAVAGLRSGATNAIGLTVEEYWLIRREIEFEGLLIGTVQGDPTETYAILVPASSAASTIADLRGQPLAVLRGPKMALAQTWLDVELARLQLPDSSEFFGPVSESTKPSRVVLPLFFGQTGVGLVNRRSFDTMVELNPQVAKRVRVLALSPPYVTSMFALARSMPADLRRRTLDGLDALDRSAAGKQVLTIFHTEHIAVQPETVLRSAFELLDEFTRTRPVASAARTKALRGTLHPFHAP